MAKKKKAKGKALRIIGRIIGIILMVIGLLYLFIPNMKPSFGIVDYRLVALGGLLLIIGSILAFNGKRIVEGMSAKGIKKHPAIALFTFIISFGLLYFWFNAMFEIISGDVSGLKILLAKISSVGISVAILIGILTTKKIFGLKSTRY